MDFLGYSKVGGNCFGSIIVITAGVVQPKDSIIIAATAREMQVGLVGVAATIIRELREGLVVRANFIAIAEFPIAKIAAVTVAD